MRLLVLSGTDGSGKTTQAYLIKSYFLKKGIKSCVIWQRSYPLFTYLLFLYARLTKKTITIKRDNITIKIHPYWNDRSLSVLYPYFIFFDTFLIYWIIRIITKLLRYNIIILDRSFVDTVIDSIWNCHSTSFLHSIIGRYLNKFLIKNRESIVFLIVSPYVAFIRKKDIVLVNEIMFKLKIYVKFSKSYKILLIDTTNKSEKQVFYEIIYKLKIDK